MALPLMEVTPLFCLQPGIEGSRRTTLLIKAMFFIIRLPQDTNF
jgi:hypothetical protein